jgi:Tol biopolymer transport system component
LVDIDGANERTLVTGLWASWSPGGRRITFNAPGVGGIGDIWTIGADGTGLTNLTQTVSGESRPDWSPNGQQIAFASNRSGNTDIWIMDADDSNVVQVTNHPSSDAAPDWSPSGQRILFQSNRCDPRLDVFVIDAQGVDDWQDTDCIEPRPINVKRLTTSPGRDLDPNWSPDGLRVVFDSDRNYTTEQIRQIFIMNADGSDQIAITFPPHEDGHASWSHGPLSAVARSISRAGGGARNANAELPPPVTNRMLERIAGLK